MKMGAGPDPVKVQSWEGHGGKSKESKERKKKYEEEETGCWFKFRFMGSCISSRASADSSLSGTSINCGKHLFYFILFLLFLYCVCF